MDARVDSCQELPPCPEAETIAALADFRKMLTDGIFANGQMERTEGELSGALRERGHTVLSVNHAFRRLLLAGQVAYRHESRPIGWTADENGRLSPFGCVDAVVICTTPTFWQTGESPGKPGRPPDPICTLAVEFVQERRRTHGSESWKRLYRALVNQHPQCKQAKNGDEWLRKCWGRRGGNSPG